MKRPGLGQRLRYAIDNTMGGFVAVYNYLGFRLEGPPFFLPASLASLVFLAYLAGTVSSRVTMRFW